MAIQNLPFVSVQADWGDVVREVASNTIAEGSFWIACYLTGLLQLYINNKQILNGYFFKNRRAECSRLG